MIYCQMRKSCNAMHTDMPADGWHAVHLLTTLLHAVAWFHHGYQDNGVYLSCETANNVPESPIRKRWYCTRNNCYRLTPVPQQFSPTFLFAHLDLPAFLLLFVGCISNVGIIRRIRNAMILYVVTIPQILFFIVSF